MYRLDCRRPFKRPRPGSIDTLHEGPADVSALYCLLTQYLKMVLIVGCTIAKMAVRNRSVSFGSRRRQVMRKLPDDICSRRVLLGQLARRHYVVCVDVVAAEELAQVLQQRFAVWGKLHFIFRSIQVLACTFLAVLLCDIDISANLFSQFKPPKSLQEKIAQSAWSRYSLTPRKAQQAICPALRSEGRMESSSANEMLGVRQAAFLGNRLLGHQPRTAPIAVCVRDSRLLLGHCSP